VILKLGGQTTKVLDKGSVELIGPFGLERILSYLSNNMASLDTGVITSYALYILIGLISYLSVPYVGLTSLLVVTVFGMFTALNTSNH
jgi:NADH-ubiquinone oxidoreductase chain 5